MSAYKTNIKKHNFIKKTQYTAWSGKNIIYKSTTFGVFWSTIYKIKSL